MARIHELIRQVAATNPSLASDLEREVDVLSERRAFGLNFERHTPEEVELPGRPVRRGDKVHVLPARGESPSAEHSRMWVVESIDRNGAEPSAALRSLSEPVAATEASLTDLVVVAEFRDPIYPGLVSTGTVERGGDKPFHSVINGENFHALQTLLFTHRGKVDAIYIDPPYNTGAHDWKYNNNYVESDDQYRHSKWLAFMERRLILAKELLNPDNSVLIVTIDEREGHRLGLLLEQIFLQAEVQMVTSVTNPKGVIAAQKFSRVDEWIFFVMLGAAAPARWKTDMLADVDSSARASNIRYANLKREGSSSRRQDRPGLFYPIFADPKTGQIVEFGEPLAASAPRSSVRDRPGLMTVWPLKPSGDEARWQQKPESARKLLAHGFLRSRLTRDGTGLYIDYLTAGQQKYLKSGRLVVAGRDEHGALIVAEGVGGTQIPKTMWRLTAHSATDHGTKVLTALVGGRTFPFPKSLYAVEDTLRFFVQDKPEATVIDFFAGSGTTAHAVFRLNKQDGNGRVSISVTNNEVSADEQKGLRERGLQPGDRDWEQFGICEHITKPRIEAAVTGATPGGDPITGEYKFTDEFPMAEGFAENVEFFSLTYEAPLQVASRRDFPKIAPLLWLRAGSRGRRIDDLTDGWDVADTYGVLADLDKSGPFLEAIAANPRVTHAFVVTDEDRLFESIVRDLPEHVEPVRMYDAYLRNFEIEGRVNR